MNGFTVNQLQKRLQKLIEQGHGREHVHVELTSFENNLDATVCQVHGIGFLTVQQLDDDGFCKINSRGGHVEKVCVTLVGDRRANNKGEIVEA